MVVQGRPLDVGGRPAVVVDHGHPVAALEDLQGLDLLRAVGVHHHHQRAVVSDEQGLLGQKEAVPILGQLAQPVGQLLGGGGPGLPDDVGGNAVFPAQGAHPGGSAHGVVVGGLVAHDEHLRGVGDQRGQGVGHHPALHLGALLRLLGPPSVELEGKLVADHRLVAPPGQGHVDGQVGKVQQLLKAVAVLADADGQRGVDAAEVDHLVDRVQNIELVLHKLSQAALLKDKQVAVPLVAAQQAAGGGGPLLQPGVQLGHDGGALVLGGVFQKVVVVVQQQNGGHRPAGLELVPDGAQLGDVHPVGGG